MSRSAPSPSFSSVTSAVATPAPRFFGRGLVGIAPMLVWLTLALAAPAEAQPERDVIAFGDSITLGLGDGSVSCFGGPSGGFPPRLSNQLDDRNYPNTMGTSAVCGELTSQGVSRLPGVLSNNPGTDVVIVMEGTNDLSDRDISTESMRFNIEAMSDIVLGRAMRPVIAAPIPRAPEAGSNDRTGFLTFLIREDAEENDVEFANTYDGLLNIPDVYDRFYADPFHPNSDGYGVVANILRDPTIAAIDRTILPPEPCAVGPENLCLAAERFEVKVEWRDADDNTGMGQAVGLTADTGFFWFFEETNIELVIKVLDGRAINGNFWVFYGALSDVEYTITVTDTEVGTVRTYFNPLGDLASRGDTGAFPAPTETLLVSPDASRAAQPSMLASVGVDGTEPPMWISAAVPITFRDDMADTATSAADRIAERLAELPRGLGSVEGAAASSKPAAASAAAATKMGCTTEGETLCLNASRFALTVNWKDSDGLEGTGFAEEVTSDTGYFWFFDAANVELVVKVLDAREINGHFWVFYGALSNVEYSMTVTDTETDADVLYLNAQGEFGSRADIEAFEVP